MTHLPKFKNPKLLEQALTHRSYANEYPENEDNERLELLGDSVVNFIVTSYLFKTYPNLPEGELTRQRSKLVDEIQLARFARLLKLGEKMRLGKGTEREGGREKDSLLSDTFEAVLGAYYLDQGIASVQSYVEPLIKKAIEEHHLAEDTQTMGNFPANIDPKTWFQQWVLGNLSKQNPIYEITSENGPDHNKQFIAKVSVQGQVYGTGKGKSKKEAEKKAATDALRQLGIARFKSFDH